MADSGSGLTSGNGSLFDLADRRLAYLQHRQQVLAQNVANANTPGYRARDLEPFAERGLATLLGPDDLDPLASEEVRQMAQRRIAGLQDPIKMNQILRKPPRIKAVELF